MKNSLSPQEKLRACVASGTAKQQRFLLAADPDSILLDDLRQLVEQAQATPIPPVARRSTDGPLRVLLLGYAGAGNTGADVRTIQTIHQLRRLFADRGLELTLFTCGTILDHPELRSARTFAPHSGYFPEALETELNAYDIVLNVEGSTYTSKFSDALAGVLISGVGLAAARGRVASAYGVDSGVMSERLMRLAKASASGVDIICRSRGTQQQLLELGLKAQLGADTAWGFRARANAAPALPERYAVLCPNNPFWWPIYTDVRRAVELDAAHIDSPLRYGSLFFHSWDDLRAARFAAYQRGFAAIAQGLAQRGYSPVFVAMAQLDHGACAEIAAHLPFHAPVLSRGAYDLDAIVATLERAQWIVTTRYHAAVLAVANCVPVIGVSMDARIDQLFNENGLADWVIPYDAPQFAARTLNQIDAGCGPVLYSLRDIYLRLASEQARRFDAMGDALRIRVQQALE